MRNRELIAVTDGAALKIKALIDSREPRSAGIRLGVKSSGCASWKYIFEYVDELLPNDKLIETNGVSIVLNKKDEFYLLGTKIDYMESDVQDGFVFENPNAKGGCGCGELFTV